jgi:hypothetical protein
MEFKAGQVTIKRTFEAKQKSVWPGAKVVIAGLDPAIHLLRKKPFAD